MRIKYPDFLLTMRGQVSDDDRPLTRHDIVDSIGILMAERKVCPCPKSSAVSRANSLTSRRRIAARSLPV